MQAEAASWPKLCLNSLLIKYPTLCAVKFSPIDLFLCVKDIKAACFWSLSEHHFMISHSHTI